ncbi:MAG: phage major capsid protein [Enterococcus sp.]
MINYEQQLQDYENKDNLAAYAVARKQANMAMEAKQEKMTKMFHSGREHISKVESKQISSFLLNPNQALLATTGVAVNDGDAFLAKELGEIILEKRTLLNPLLAYIDVTNYRSLDKFPMLAGEPDTDIKLIEDGVEAKVINLKGKSVSYRQRKSKLYVEVSESINSFDEEATTDFTLKTQLLLAGYVSAQELDIMFAATPQAGTEGGNFYDASNGIKEVTGADLYESINAAIDALPYENRVNATVVVKEAEFKAMRKTLADAGKCCLGDSAEALFGYPTVFIDAATKPIVGDFNFYNINYFSSAFDTRKIVKNGNVQAVLTTEFDAHVLNPDAFRIATI